MRASLVIPCYNEAKSLPALVERCSSAVQAEPTLDIVLIDNGSTDGSAAILSELGSRPRLSTLRVEKNIGYGYGVLQGLAAARGDIVGWTHADLQADPMDAVTGLQIFKAAPDWHRLYVKGHRYERPVSDVIFTAGMSAFETLLLGVPMQDINAQPNLFPRALFESWKEPPNDFSLDLFAYHSAKIAGYRLARFPVKFGERQFGQSHWNIDWRSKFKFIRRTVNFSLELRKRLSESRA